MSGSNKITISLEFDTLTQTVSNIVVNGTSTEVPVKVVRKLATKATPVAKDTKNILFSGSSLKLTQEVLDLLDAKQGKKLVLEIVGNKVSLLNPAITSTKGGNLITGALTVACKGKAGEQLKEIGDEFTFTKHSAGELRLSPVGKNLDIAPVKEQPEVQIPTESEVKDVLLETLGEDKDADFDFDFNNLL